MAGSAIKDEKIYLQQYDKEKRFAHDKVFCLYVCQRHLLEKTNVDIFIKLLQDIAGKYLPHLSKMWNFTNYIYTRH